MALNEYDVVVNGHQTTLQLSDEDAKLQGLTKKDLTSTRLAAAEADAEAARAEAAERERVEAEAAQRAEAEAAKAREAEAAKAAAAEANKAGKQPANKQAGGAQA